MLRKTLAATAALVLVLVSGTAARAAEDPVYITSVAGGRCLDAAARYNGANGTPIQLWDCYPPTQYNQMWRVHWLTDWDFQLINVASGRCLEAKDWSTVSGTRLQLWDCFGLSNKNQIWHAQSTNTPGAVWLVEQHSFKVLDAAAQYNGANGTPVQLWDRVGSETRANQRWIVPHF
ncbi:RICIN domain-containing protein [Lentzea sp. NPDC004782]|uniref:RICIN domain-containing protein n=1 Tax=Lentzea sp. NPDC004782 TaxID=3154458 RepID=UPI0033B919BB